MGSDKVTKFLGALDKLSDAATAFQSPEEQRAFAAELLTKAKSGKGESDFGGLVDIGLQRIQKTAEVYPIFVLLKCHLLFKEGKWFEFRRQWGALTPESVEATGFVEANPLFAHYCELWRKKMTELSRGAELDQRIEASNQSDFPAMYELSELQENINALNSVQLLAGIIEKDPTWNESAALKKLGVMSTRLKAGEARTQAITALKRAAERIKAPHK